MGSGEDAIFAPLQADGARNKDDAMQAESYGVRNLSN